MKHEHKRCSGVVDAERILNNLEKSFFNGLFKQAVFPGADSPADTDGLHRAASTSRKQAS